MVHTCATPEQKTHPSFFVRFFIINFLNLNFVVTFVRIFNYSCSPNNKSLQNIYKLNYQ